MTALNFYLIMSEKKSMVKDKEDIMVKDLKEIGLEEQKAIEIMYLIRTNKEKYFMIFNQET